MDTSSTGAAGAATDSSNANPVYHGSAEQFRDAPRRFSPRPQGSYLNSVTPPRSPSQRVRPSRARRYRSPDPTEDEDDEEEFEEVEVSFNQILNVQIITDENYLRRSR